MNWQSEVRVYPDVLNQQILDLLGLNLGLVGVRPEHRDARAGRDPGAALDVLDDRLQLDLVDEKFNLMLAAVCLDPGLTSVVIAQHVAHRQDGLQSVALPSARRADVRLAAEIRTL